MLEDWLQAVQLVLIWEQVSHYEAQVWQLLAEDEHREQELLQASQVRVVVLP